MRFAITLVLYLWMHCALVAQSSIDPMPINEIEDRLLQALHEKQSALRWHELDIELLWSTLIHTDSLCVIGYKPKDIPTHREAIMQKEFNNEKWMAAQKAIEKIIWDAHSATNKKKPSYANIFPITPTKARPYLYAKVYDLATLKQLRQHPDIRYIEPANFELNLDKNKSGEGCSNYSGTIDAVDYSPISPAAIKSWTHTTNGIDTAWTKSNKGEGIWIAVMDTGVSDTNPKYNGNFDEGESSGRSLEKEGVYAPNTVPDGWQDQCGHGTAMASLIAAPRGFNDSPAGVAYRANLVSYRVTNDVRINTTAEIDGLRDGLYAAADDSRIAIISMSLGDVFSHGPVEDGVIYAHDLGKLIFAAAGTSTSFTNWFGVIAPANMPEAIAITGLIEGSNFERCDICHSGNEVEFALYMERANTGNKAITSTNDNAANNEYRGYVGGSSAATAMMAGVAGLIWGNNPTFDKDQVLNRLIQSSSEYPNKDADFGWGTIDACLAVDTTAALPCSASLSNEVTMELTSITFPPTNDGVGNAEWVLKIGGQSYYFSVPNGGATGNPNAFIEGDVCDNIPIIIDLGTTLCGADAVSLLVETHEDDGFSSECDFGSGDDDQTISTELVVFSNNSFTQSTSNGDFVFTYSLACAPILVSGLSNNGPICSGEDIVFTASPAGQSNYHFFLDANDNGLLDTGESLQTGLADSYTASHLEQGDIVGIEVSDANGCSSYSFASVQIINYAGVNTLLGTELSIADYETNDTIHSTQIIENTAVVDYDAGVEIELLSGFEVKTGAVFEAFIDGCNGGQGGSN